MAVPLCFLRNTLVKKEWSSLVYNPHKGNSKSKRMRVFFQLEDIGILQALHVEIGIGSWKQELDGFTYAEWSLSDVGIRSICLFFNILLVGMLSLVFGDILYAVLWLQRTKRDKISNLLPSTGQTQDQIGDLPLWFRATSCLQLPWESHKLVVIVTILKGNFEGQSEWQVCMWTLARRAHDVSAVAGNRGTSLHVLCNSVFGQSWKNVHFQVPVFWSHI